VTVAAPTRQGDIRTAKERLLRLVADADVRHVHFDSSHPIFSDLLPTTFWTLKQAGVIEERPTQQMAEDGGPLYRMNHNRWAAVLVELDESTRAFEDRKGQFCGAVKKSIWREGPPVTMPVNRLAAFAGLPVGWCWNAIRGNLFCQVKDAPRWGQLRYDDDTVTLPPTWGQRP